MGAASSKRQIEGYKNRRKPKPVVSEASTSSLTPSKKNGDGGGSGGGVGISAGTKDETIQTVAPQADTESDKKQIKPLAVDTKPDVALTASEMEKIRFAFEEVDSDHNGFLGRNEIKKALEKLGHKNPTDETVQDMLSAVGLGIADAICLEEFEIMWKDNIKANGSEWSVGSVLSNVPLVGGLFSPKSEDAGSEESKSADDPKKSTAASEG